MLLALAGTRPVGGATLALRLLVQEIGVGLAAGLSIVWVGTKVSLLPAPYTSN